MSARTPADAFEAELFRTFIAYHVQEWQVSAPLKPHVGMARPDGTWDIGVMDTSAKLSNPFAPAPADYEPVVMSGTVWLEDHGGMPVVCWEMGGQSGTDRAPETGRQS